MEESSLVAVFLPGADRVGSEFDLLSVHFARFLFPSAVIAVIVQSTVLLYKVNLAIFKTLKQG
ncbi:MAG: hypothetical protein U0Z75_07400 [Deinococcaceae bacterium]